jgi:beta-galactosidase
VGNGNSTSFEPFQADYRKAFNGLCLLIIRAEKIGGDITIMAQSDGLEMAKISLSTVYLGQ